MTKLHTSISFRRVSSRQNFNLRSNCRNINFVFRFSTLLRAPAVPVADSIRSLAPSHVYERRFVAEGRAHVGALDALVYSSRLISDA